MTPDNRPAVYAEEPDKIIYRASALGHCLRMLWGARCNMDRKPIPAVIQQGMDEGTNLEPVILNLLYEKHGFTFADNTYQWQVELNVGAFNGKTLIVRGSCDEVGCPYDDSLPPNAQPFKPIDVKALTDADVERYRVRGFAAYPHYAYQQSVYAHGLGTPLFYMPIFHKGTWSIEPWSLEPLTPPKSLEEIRDRVLQVEEAWADNKMPEVCDNYYACPYPYLHDTKPIDVIPNDLQQLVSGRIKLAQRIAVYDSARKKLDEAIKSRLQPDVTYHHDGFTITVLPNPRRFNTEAAKKVLTDAELDWENDEFFWTPGNGVQIRFTPPKKDSTNG